MDETKGFVPEPTCSICGAKTIPVICGFPMPELGEAAWRGKVALGSCGVMEGTPDQVCTGAVRRYLYEGELTPDE